MKPYYYQEGGQTIYCGDCREILPSLPHADLCLTDAPYGMDYQSCRRVDWQRKPKIEGDNEFPLWIFDLLKPRRAFMVFCRWDNLCILPPPKSFIVWDKMIHSMGDLNHEWARQWEGIAFYPQADHKFAFRPKDVIRVQRISPDKLLHPNEKPVELMLQLIKPNECETILDPFMGVGSVILAAKQLGRRAIGIEIDERYCEIAAKRLSQTVMNLEALPEKADQTALL